MVVYAMRVTDKMTMHEYDAWAREHRSEKVPDAMSPASGRHERGVDEALRKVEFATLSEVSG
jgi:hypothetical protein